MRLHYFYKTKNEKKNESETTSGIDSRVWKMIDRALHDAESVHRHGTLALKTKN